MKRNARQVTSPTGRTGMAALLLAKRALTSSARAAMCAETGRRGRPWPPAPGYW